MCYSEILNSSISPHPRDHHSAAALASEGRRLYRRAGEGHSTAHPTTTLHYSHHAITSDNCVGDGMAPALTHRIQFGGDEVVKAKDGLGSATLSMAFAGALQGALSLFIRQMYKNGEWTGCDDRQVNDSHSAPPFRFKRGPSSIQKLLNPCSNQNFI